MAILKPLLFLKFWSILNVTSPTVGRNKRDITRDAIKSPDDWKLEFLLEFGSLIEIWQNTGVSAHFELNTVTF